MTQTQLTIKRQVIETTPAPTTTPEAEYDSLLAAEAATYTTAFPGSKAWMRYKAAMDAVRAFEAAHPEVAAATKTAKAAARKAEYSGLSDFVKAGC